MEHPPLTRRSIGIAVFGTLLEWAEYTFYAYMAYHLSQIFFPTTDPYTGLLLAYGTFAVGYCMRPLGAMLFGYYGDRYGRKPALVYAVLLMAVSTFCIGLMPTYATCGIGAPLGLLLCRLLQGLSMGGEYHGAGIYLLESPTSHPYLRGSWIAASAAMGMVIGATVAAILALPGLPLWAWRVPFLVGGIMGGALYLARRALPETTTFLSLPQRTTRPLKEIFCAHRTAMLRVGAIAALIGVHVYIANVYWVNFLVQTVHLPRTTATQLSVVSELLVALWTPGMGWLADKWGGNRLFRLGAACLTVSCPLMFWLSQQASFLSLTGAVFVFALTQSALSGPLFKIIFDTFPTAIRYTGLSVSWSLSVALFSGTAPMVATYLDQQWPGGYGPSLYVAFIAFATYHILRERTI